MPLTLILNKIWVDFKDGKVNYTIDKILIAIKLDRMLCAFPEND